MHRMALLFTVVAFMGSSHIRAQTPDLVFETTRAGPLVLWTRADSTTVFALATITAPDGTVQYQPIFNPRAYNRTLMDLHDGDTVVIAEVKPGEAQPVAIHRSTPYAAVWRLRLALVIGQR